MSIDLAGFGNFQGPRVLKEMYPFSQGILIEGVPNDTTTKDVSMRCSCDILVDNPSYGHRAREREAYDLRLRDLEPRSILSGPL